MIELITSAESLEQAYALVDLGVSQVIIGEAEFGLRIPGHFTFEEMKQVCEYAHQKGTQVVVAANAILHNEKIKKARPFLAAVKKTGADKLLVGDTGLIQILKEEAYRMPYIYDAAVLVTSSGQVNFWAKYGAVASMVAHEVPLFELQEMVQGAEIPLIYQVYGSACIHQSRRELLTNYFSYVGHDAATFEGRHLFLSEPNKPETHYSIYQDDHGTHIFANDDLNLLAYLPKLQQASVDHWFLDGLYCPGSDFVAIVEVYQEAAQALESGEWDQALLDQWQTSIQAHHPANRSLGTGFFLHEPGLVK